jgi:hypothetical protein
MHGDHVHSHTYSRGGVGSVRRNGTRLAVRLDQRLSHRETPRLRVNEFKRIVQDNGRRKEVDRQCNR